jgi:hypothetical protein
MTVTSPAPINIHPTLSRGRVEITSLPYEDYRADLDCGHSNLYLVQAESEGPLLCGLCFFRDGYEAELPASIHLHKALAENGNPETIGLLMSHLNVVMGLIPPKKGEDIKAYQRRRNALAREQYTTRSPLPDHRIIQQVRHIKFTSPSWRMFPVASSLWKLMGYQPPLGIVLVRGVGGRVETEIASELDISHMDVHIRMAKAIRTAIRYLPRSELQ